MVCSAKDANYNPEKFFRSRASISFFVGTVIKSSKSRRETKDNVFSVSRKFKMSKFYMSTDKVIFRS